MNGGVEFDEVVIESSPFLRVMQTCAGICKGMGSTKFRLNYLPNEYMSKLKGTHNSDPLPHLLSKARTKTPEEKEEFVKKYLDGIDFTDDDQNLDMFNELRGMPKKWYETEKDLKNRVIV